MHDKRRDSSMNIKLLLGSCALFACLIVATKLVLFRTPRIALITISTPNRSSFSKYTLDSFRRYADKWHYDLYCFTESLDPSRPVQWSKIKAVADLMNQGNYDWYVWLDDDIYITNPDIPLEQVIHQYGQKAALIISAHKEKLPAFNDVNSGLFLIKNTSWSKKFLQRVWNIGYERYNQLAGSFWEQSAMQELLEMREFKDSPAIARLAARKIQSFVTLLHKGDTGDYGQWQPGDFAAHLAGAHDDVREMITQQFAHDTRAYPWLYHYAAHFTIKQT